MICTSENTGDIQLGGRHGGASITVGGAFESNYSKNEEVHNPSPKDKRVKVPEL